MQKIDCTNMNECVGSILIRCFNGLTTIKCSLSALPMSWQ